MSHSEVLIKREIKKNQTRVRWLKRAHNGVPLSLTLRIKELEAELRGLHTAPVVPVVPVVPFVPAPAVVGTVAMYNASANVDGTPQAAALAMSDEPYILPGLGQSGVPLPGFTPNSARAWWTEYFANPFDMRLVDPAALPGSLVLTAEEGKRAVAIGKTVTRVPPQSCAGVPCPANPNLYEGSSTLQAIRSMQDAGNPSYPPFPAGTVFPSKAP